jgi:GNAT superfamily N-acetyltransferase
VTAALRPGRDEDADGFIALIAGCWAEYPGCIMDVDGENPELRALASHLAALKGALWTAELDGRVVGMVAVFPREDGEWQISRMYVERGQRGTGLAQRLIETAEAHARSHGATDMRLCSDSRFDRAHAFYERNSYVRDGALIALGDVSNTIDIPFSKPLTGRAIRRLDAASASSAVRRLALILVACVESGASVSFLPPMPVETARQFWRRAASGVATGQRVILAAWLDGALVGCVTLDLAMPQNQPHRAEVQKMLVLPEARRHGLARALMQAAEDAARGACRSLLVLDTQAGGAAEPLYRSLGWNETGRIPGFSTNAAGTFDDTVIFWKRVG